MTEEKVRENRLRRIAKRRGYQLTKSRRRDPQALDFEGYMLVDAQTNVVILGATAWSFSATLDDVDDFFSERKPRVKVAKRVKPERKRAGTRKRS